MKRARDDKERQQQEMKKQALLDRKYELWEDKRCLLLQLSLIPDRSHITGQRDPKRAQLQAKLRACEAELSSL